jgi:hypothetical protein
MKKLVFWGAALVALIDGTAPLAGTATKSPHPRSNYFTTNELRAEVPKHVEKMFGRFDVNHDGLSAKTRSRPHRRISKRGRRRAPPNARRASSIASIPITMDRSRRQNSTPHGPRATQGGRCQSRRAGVPARHLFSHAPTPTRTGFSPTRNSMQRSPAARSNRVTRICVARRSRACSTAPTPTTIAACRLARRSASRFSISTPRISTTTERSRPKNAGNRRARLARKATEADEQRVRALARPSLRSFRQF